MATVGSTNYTDIDKALADWATNGGTLTLLQNAEFSTQVNITATSDTELDLNGKTLKATVLKAIVVKSGTLTIKDTQGEGSYESSASAPLYIDGGNVILTNGTIKAPGGVYGTIGVRSKSSLTMTGGNVISTGKMTNDGQLDTSKGYAIFMFGGGDKKRSTVTISGGTVTSVAEAIYMKDSATLKINNNPAIGQISEFTDGPSYTPELEINGGIIDGLTVNVQKLGTFIISDSARFNSAIDEALFSTTYSCVKTDDGHYKAQAFTADDAKVSLSSTDGTTKYYGSLVDAARAITSGQTLKLLDDYTGTEAVIMNSTSYGVTVDLNGHSITNTSTASDAVALKMQAAGTSKGASFETAKLINTSDETATLTGLTALGIHSANGIFTVDIAKNIDLVSTGSTEKFALTGGAYLQESAVNPADVNAYWKTADGKLFNDFTYAAKYNSGDSGEISLVKDYSGRAQIQTSATVNLNGHTYTYTGSGCIVDLYTLSETDTTAMSLSITNGTIRSDGKSVTGIMTSGNQTNVTVSLDSVTLSVPNGRGIFFPSAGSLTIKDSVIEGKYFGVQMCAGSLTVSGDETEITATGTPVAKIENDGPIDDGAAISIVNRTGYKDLGKVSIQDGAFKSNNASKAVKAYSFNNTDKAEGAWNDAASTVEITGGHYTSDPSAYVKSTEAAPRYVVDSTKEGYSYMVTSETPGEAPVIVADKTETEVTLPGTVSSDVKTEVESIINNANVDGVAEALTETAKSNILQDAGVTDSDKAATNAIIIDVSVKVKATGATEENNALKTLTFEASPVATVTVGTVTKKTDITVDNNYLNGQAITVKLPLPENFKPEQIKHTSADGSTEYFLLTQKRGAKTFTIEDGCAVFTITKFSTFEVSGTESYVEPSSSGSGSSSTNYNVNVNAATNGTVTADKKTAAKGATVTITATPSTGYVVDKITVVDKDGKAVDVTAKDGKYSFVMPASAVTVTATFKTETPAPSGLPFVDVKSGDWFYDAVKYAYENGLMNGTSATTFAPNGTMNRAMIVTVLYRLEKTPAVTTAAKFADVPAGQWYSDAVAWAAANNIVNGYNETTFGPMNAVTREQMAAILYRYEQYKGMDTVTLEENLARFPDKDKVSAYAVPAMQWAVGQKVINGNADGTLNPTGTATRAQVAQIFTNLLNK